MNKFVQVKLFQDLLGLAFLDPIGLPLVSFEAAKDISRSVTDCDHRLVSQNILVDQPSGRHPAWESHRDVEYWECVRGGKEPGVNVDVLTGLDTLRTAPLWAPRIENCEKFLRSQGQY